MQNVHYFAAFLLVNFSKTFRLQLLFHKRNQLFKMFSCELIIHGCIHGEICFCNISIQLCKVNRLDACSAQLSEKTCIDNLSSTWSLVKLCLLAIGYLQPCSCQLAVLLYWQYVFCNGICLNLAHDISIVSWAGTETIIQNNHIQLIATLYWQYLSQ